MAETLDVSVERIIPALPERVAAVMFDPVQDPRWMKALTESVLLDAPLASGSRVRRNARFLGRTIGWTTTVAEYSPPRLLVLDISDGPFVGVVTYEIEPSGSGSLVRIRNVGQPGKFGWMPSALMQRVMRTSLAKDLSHLEAALTS
ncbi:MAG: SRPBCC family protein [Acidimicrobiia bacterium]